jgi:dipeptidyl aminopeptidase/acylaminoacyl peptidase
MLLHPDFYKVAVSSAGSYDGPAMYSPVLEKYFGKPDYESGSIQAGPSDRPGYIWKTSASANADKLQGRLLLAVGDLDENAPPAAAFQFVKALIAADRSFDFLYLPGRNHYFSRELYFIKQRWDYFVEYLLGAEPLRHYKLKVPNVRPPLVLR